MENKTVLITGASQGIGKVIAEEFAKESYNIAFSYRSEEKKESLLLELKKYKTEVLAIKGDVSNYNDAEEIVKKTIEKFGQIDTLINNAGITKDNISLRMSQEDFQKVIEVNLYGSFYFSKLVGAHMLKKRQGSIISISSVVGLHGNPGQINYAASKAGINAMTKTLAKELASRSIRVNAIAPGFIKTDMTDKLSDKVKEQILDSIPMKRIAEPIEIANMALFLASDKARYITGQIISVDGGMNI